jgi:hypothetical protein
MAELQRQSEKRVEALWIHSPQFERFLYRLYELIEEAITRVEANTQQNLNHKSGIAEVRGQPAGP